ncbi:MAG: hypothetical protein IPM57_08205 [Oligoflexia bacterium]|nr:hypothetical protein [Oligoflexia bacterium]
MQQETAVIFKMPLLILALFFIGCADNPIADPPIKSPSQRVFYDNYDKVWRAVQLALRKYPVKVNTMESGILETDYIKGDKLFNDPNEAKTRPGLRYKIIVRAIKGKIESKSAIKVTVLKNAEIQTDFFSGFKALGSNGLEEELLLYRIGRFIEIDNALTKASK